MHRQTEAPSHAASNPSAHTGDRAEDCTGSACMNPTASLLPTLQHALDRTHRHTLEVTNAAMAQLQEGRTTRRPTASRRVRHNEQAQAEERQTEADERTSRASKRRTGRHANCMTRGTHSETSTIPYPTTPNTCTHCTTSPFPLPLPTYTSSKSSTRKAFHRTRRSRTHPTSDRSDHRLHEQQNHASQEERPHKQTGLHSEGASDHLESRRRRVTQGRGTQGADEVDDQGTEGTSERPSGC